MRNIMHKFSTKKLVAFLTVGGFLLPFAYAEDTPTQKVDQVEVVGNTNEDQRRSSITAKIVVNKEEITRFGDANIVDILRRVPGITVGTAPGRGSDIRMRGLGNGYTQILLNGDPVPPGFSIDSLSPSLIERIEVSRVPTADQSTQAIAGTINIILKQIARKSQRELKASLVGYSNTPSIYLDGQTADRSGNFSYSIAGSIGREDYVRPSELQQRDFDEAGRPILSRTVQKEIREQGIRLNLTPRFKWDLNKQESLTFEALLGRHSTHGGTVESRSTAYGPLPLYANDTIKQEIDITTLRSKLGWSRKFDNQATAEVKLGANFGQTKGAATFLGFDADRRIVQHQDITSVAKDKSFTLSGNYRTSFAEQHAISVGWDGEYSQRYEDRIQRTTAAPGYPDIDLDEIYNVHVKRIALFAQDEWDISPKASLYWGVRWENLKTGTTGNVPEKVGNTSSVLSPMVQAKWKLSDSKNDQVRLAISRTYKAPAIRDLNPRRFVATDNTPTTPDRQGNPDLRPELAWGLDLGYEHYFAGDAGLISSSAFLRRIDEVIIRQTSFVDNAWISRPMNIGPASVKSVEIEAKIRTKKLFKDWPDVDLRTNFAWNWSRLDMIPGPDNRLDRQRPFAAGLGIDYRNASMPMTLGASFTYEAGGQTRLSANQSSYLNPRRILDLYGLWKVNDRTQIRLAASNVLKQEAIESTTYSDHTGVFTQATTEKKRIVIRASIEIKL